MEGRRPAYAQQPAVHHHYQQQQQQQCAESHTQHAGFAPFAWPWHHHAQPMYNPQAPHPQSYWPPPSSYNTSNSGAQVLPPPLPPPQQQQQRPIPCAWQQFFDVQSGQNYYHDRVSGATTWQAPPHFKPLQPPPPPQRASMDSSDDEACNSELDVSDSGNRRCWGRPRSKAAAGAVGIGESEGEEVGGRFRTISCIDEASLHALTALSRGMSARRKRCSGSGLAVADAADAPLPVLHRRSDGAAVAAAAATKMRRASLILASSSSSTTNPNTTVLARRSAGCSLQTLAAARLPRALSLGALDVSNSLADLDAAEELLCVSAVIHAHMVQFMLAPPVPSCSRYAAFDELQPGQDAPDAGPAATKQHHRRRSSTGLRLPTREAVFEFLQDVYTRAQMEKECILMAFVYLERLLKATRGLLSLHDGNWRGVVLSTLILASKVWDDLSMLNADFSKICPAFDLRRVNELEVTLLEAVQYQVRVSASQYARCHFVLRGMRRALGIAPGTHGKDDMSLSTASGRARLAF